MVTSDFEAHVAPIDRFWLPADRAYGLDQSGWLQDRDVSTYYGTNLDMVTTAELSSKRCLVLLGEPGMGKSATITSQSPLLPAGTSAQVLHVDLASYSSEDRLVRKVFEGPEVTSWLNSRSELCLTFDSFDEAHGRIENLHQLVGEYLDVWDCSRLQLRIVSRTAEWPTSLEMNLKKHFDEVVPYELLPLRRDDAALLLGSYGIDPDEFLLTVEASQAVPLASRPLTLKLLASTYKREGNLPQQAFELYGKGLLTLCEEMNPSRRDAARGPAIPAAARLDTASRLAALSIFGGRPTFWLGPQVEADKDTLTIEDCSGDYLANLGVTSGEQTAVAVTAVLRTGIFSGRGNRTLGWSHATFADYLAARWVLSSQLNQNQVSTLLESNSGKLHPRIRQIAAWLVAMDPRYAWLIAVDPEAFIMNIEMPDAGLRQEIVSGIFSKARDGKIHHDYLRNFSGLNHPAIAEQIRNALSENSYDTARIAIDIARDCNVEASIPDLSAIALDEDADLDLRVAAAWAVFELSKDRPGAYLLPLLVPSPVVGDGVGQNQELLGAALMASWPHAVSSAEVFKLLKPQQPKNYFGLYSIFINRFAESLTAVDLVPASSWLASQPELWGDSSMAALVESILALSLKNLEQEAALAAAVRIVKSRLQEFEPWFKKTSHLESLDLSVDQGRILAGALLDEADPVTVLALTDRYGLGGPALINAGDFEWLMDEYVASSGTRQKNIARALQRIADPENRAHLDTILGLANDHPVASVFASWRDAIDLNSQEATEERELLALHEKTRKMVSARKKKEEETDEEARTKILDLLPKAKGGDAEAFWKLTRYLTIPPGSGRHEAEHQPDLTKHPRWQALTPENQEDILIAASLYLRGGACAPGEWVGKDIWYYPARAGYRALVLLLRNNPEGLRFLEPAVWRAWGPIIIGWGPTADEENREDKRQILRLALPHARRELTETLLHLVDKAIADKGHVFFRDEFELLDSPLLASALITRLKSGNLPEVPMWDLIDILMVSHSESITPLLVGWLGPQERESQPEKAAQAMMRLLFNDSDKTWTVLSELMDGDPEFLKTVVLSIGFMDRRKAPKLGDTELAALYEWLLINFPPEADPTTSEISTVGPPEVVAAWRDTVLETLVKRGTASSVLAVKGIVDAHPARSWLKYSLSQAEATLLERSWEPVTPEQLDRLAASRKSRLVRSEADLFAASLEALIKVQERLQGDTPSSPLLWDTHSKRPKSEDEVSDYLRTELQNLLLQSGVVVNREVQVRRILPSPLPERTDLRIDAVTSPAGAAADLITIAGEVKGCWNKEILGSVQSQLVDRYMADIHSSFGIYIVIWFDPESWTPSDQRRRSAAAFGGLEELRAALNVKVSEQAKAGHNVALVILDASLRRPVALNV
ncbi:NACHT domain-containing protein [Arthrobacter sp. NPDC057259]|uniref:NACHT domain-containing protein n=1 Tax=Arthrobacter sp. NPDC057259 TaxID=3346073 RepID=UPI00362A1FF5